jgi:ABC-type microcin C transport system duplicated ATPase subunit YejF
LLVRIIRAISLACLSAFEQIQVAFQDLLHLGAAVVQESWDWVVASCSAICVHIHPTRCPKRIGHLEDGFGCRGPDLAIVQLEVEGMLRADGARLAAPNQLNTRRELLVVGNECRVVPENPHGQLRWHLTEQLVPSGLDVHQVQLRADAARQQVYITDPSANLLPHTVRRRPG